MTGSSALANVPTPSAIVANVNELGGISRAANFVRARGQFNVGFRLHSGDTGIAGAAYLQLAAALEHVRGVSQALFHCYAGDVIEGGALSLENGMTPVPVGP